MRPAYWVLIGLAVVWAVAFWLNRRRIRTFENTGDPDDGIVIFVEPLRWAFIIWGFVGFAKGLRRGGCRKQLGLWRYCTPLGAVFVLPDLAARKRLQADGARLASRVEELAAQHPGRRIDIVGYSTGCYVTLEACRRIQRPEALGEVVLLSGAVWPGYDFEGLEDQVRTIHSFHSRIDPLVGLGLLICGTNDRHHSPGCGTLGFRNAPDWVIQRGWRPSDILLGYLGEHMTITSPAFVAREVVPILDSREADRLKK